MTRPIYISGPMSGKPHLNFPAFHACTEQLRGQGWTVVSPHEHGGDAASWLDYMRVDLADLCECGAIALLPGWPESRGARLELSLALGLGLDVYYWLDGRLVAA